MKVSVSGTLRGKGNICSEGTLNLVQDTEHIYENTNNSSRYYVTGNDEKS